MNERKEEYKRGLRAYKKEICSVKEKNWKQFVSKWSNVDPWGSMYKLCRGKKGDERLSTLSIDGRMTNTWEESAGALLENHFPASRLGVVYGSGDVGENGVNECRFECSEIEDAIRRVKMRKAPGLDSITGEMVRRVWCAIPEWLHRLNL